jgi:hypothetical protein
VWYNSSVAASVMSLPVEASPLSSIAIFDFTLLCFTLLYFALLLVDSYDTGGCKKVLLLVVSSMEFQCRLIASKRQFKLIVKLIFIL